MDCHRAVGRGEYQSVAQECGIETYVELIYLLPGKISGNETGRRNGGNKLAVDQIAVVCIDAVRGQIGEVAAAWLPRRP